MFKKFVHYISRATIAGILVGFVARVVRRRREHERHGFVHRFLTH